MSRAVLFTAAVALSVAGVAAKALRHADEAKALIGPGTRAIVSEIEDGHAADAITATQVASEDRGKDR